MNSPASSHLGQDSPAVCCAQPPAVVTPHCDTAPRVAFLLCPASLPPAPPVTLRGVQRAPVSGSASGTVGELVDGCRGRRSAAKKEMEASSPAVPEHMLRLPQCLDYAGARAPPTALAQEKHFSAVPTILLFVIPSICCPHETLTHVS